MASLLSDEILKLPYHFKYIKWCRPGLDSIESKNVINQSYLKLKWSHQKIFVVLHLATKLLKWSTFELFLIATMLNPVWQLMNAFCSTDCYLSSYWPHLFQKYSISIIFCVILMLISFTLILQYCHVIIINLFLYIKTMAIF